MNWSAAKVACQRMKHGWVSQEVSVVKLLLGLSHVGPEPLRIPVRNGRNLHNG
jgi:hypothetical protein